MSLNFARELLKISLSELCSSIGFDSISEIGMDLLIDVCERQFLYLSKQTSNLIQINHRYQPNLIDLLNILYEFNSENVDQLEEYIQLFKSLHFNKDILQFPYKKKNQFYLRIPPKDSIEVIQRDQNETTQYIYDWLPLFPDQETPEQSSTINNENNFETTIDQEQEKKFDKDDSHHPLTLLSFLSKNGDEPNLIPVGKRPTRSLPTVLYRPRRIIEVEAALAAAEKAKKEQFDKENSEKDPQGPPPPLRLTISKPLVNNDKQTSSVIKKMPTNPDLSTNKKPSIISTITTNLTSINIQKKLSISPPINPTNETHSIITNPTINSTEISSNSDKNEQTALDLTKPTNKLPTLKLSIKPVPNTPTTINSETTTTTPPNNKPPKSSTNTKTSTTTPEKVSVKIRTPSLSSFGTNSLSNENPSMISPPLSLSIRNPTSSTQPSTDQNTNIRLHTNNNNNNNNDTNDKNLSEIVNPNNLNNQLSLSQKNSNQQQQEQTIKKKKKKKTEDDKQEKRIKKDIQINPNQQLLNNNDFQTNTNTNTNLNNSESNQPPAGAIRLKIKIGKAPTTTTTTNPTDQMNSSNSNLNQQPTNTEIKANPIRLTLSVPSSTNSLISSSSTTSTNNSINVTPNKRKSIKVKHIPPINEKIDMNKRLNDDNNDSMDDLPLGERTSPNKILFNNNQTPIKKKSITIKKKINQKRQNNIVGVAVIEERRIHHDSQEKIWICPSCNRPDNGQEAMIACDLCDDWYHWECVGIVEEPPESIPWFCPKCHRSNSSTTSAQGIKPSASSKAKRKRASTIYQQQQQQQNSSI